jgi:hypothetical protein
MSTLTQVDPVEAQQIGASLVKTVRKLMLKQE